MPQNTAKITIVRPDVATIVPTHLRGHDSPSSPPPTPTIADLYRGPAITQHRARYLEEPIGPFRGPYRFLSNFYGAPVRVFGTTWPTAEHAYQAQKSFEPEEQLLIRRAATPGEAKRLARGLHMRRDWHAVRVPLMTEIVRAKFTNPSLARRLLATGTRPLIEYNTWSDYFWGVCRGRGINTFGRILMRIRDELRDRAR